jgi:aspartyl-tRNA(Asn)/glutamyl-tRNA(Gln) amidotransferase subunit A
MSVPCGFSSGGLPIGLQILGSHFSEEMLLKIAYNLEIAVDLTGRKPQLD